MFRKSLLLLTLSFCLCLPAFSQEITPPKLEAVATLEKHQPLIQEAIALHDQQLFDAAIAKYEKVLAENPHDTLALYELGFSYSAKGEYKKALEVAYKGAQYKSKNLVGFYVLIGNNLDNLNDSEKAIKVYKSALNLFPHEPQLHFNLAVTYLKLRRNEDGKKSIKDTMIADPNYRSSHYILGQLYFQERYKIPALLAVCRFLIVEPNSQRSAGALQALRDTLQQGVSKGDKENTINIQIDPTPGKKDEGDFDSVAAILPLLMATRTLEKNKDKSEMQLTVENFESFFAVLDESSADKKSSGFAWNYYRPYFVEMKKRNHVEAFTYYIYQTSGIPGVLKWLQQNAAKVQEFLDWSQSYKWSNGK